MSTTDSGASEVTDDARIRRRIRRAILPVAFLLYTFNYMDRSSISYAQLTMSEDLGIDIATYGTVAAIFFVAYVLLEVPSNIIMSKVGARLWLSRIGDHLGTYRDSYRFRENETQLFIARIALGIAEAGLFPGLVLYLTYWFRTRDRARALSAMVLAQPVALILGSVSAGFILDHVTWFGLESWRWVFILQGIPPIILGIWTLVYLADRPSKARWLSRQQSAALENSIAAEYQGDRDDHYQDRPAGAEGPEGPLPRVHPPARRYRHLWPRVLPAAGGRRCQSELLGDQHRPRGCLALSVRSRGPAAGRAWSDLHGNRKGAVIACLSTSVSASSSP